MILQTLLNDKGEFKSDYLQDNIINLLDTTFEFPDSYTYNIFEVTEDYIARPDLISYDAYGDAMYADVICKLNGVSNPFELNEGMKIIVPTPDDISRFIIEPSIKDKDSNWGPSGGVSDSTKTKKSKRQANEAIMGDTRFKIDKANGVIIY